MTLEEVKKFLEDNEEGKKWLQSQIDESIEGLQTKNSELIGKNKKLKEERDNYLSENSTLTEKVEELEDMKIKKTDDVKAEVEKVTVKFKKEIEALTGERDAATSRLNKSLIDNGLKDALIAANVDKDHMPLVTAFLKTNNKIDISVDEEDNPRAIIGDKPISDFVTEWANSDSGKKYVVAKDNSGGGANNRSGGGATHEELSKMSPTERLMAARERS